MATKWRETIQETEHRCLLSDLRHLLIVTRVDPVTWHYRVCLGHEKNVLAEADCAGTYKPDAAKVLALTAYRNLPRD
jgi:hypothetical protein